MSEYCGAPVGCAFNCDTGDDHAPPAPTCLWCKGPIPVLRRHGSVRKFCCAHHRQAFWKALRRYGLAQLQAGNITVEFLRRRQQSVNACAVRPQAPFQDPPCVPLPESEKAPA